MTEHPTTSALNARDDLRELADRYETVAALEPVATTSPVRTPPGSRVPPGVQEILDADEVARVLVAVDEWAGFLVGILVDEVADRARNFPATSTPSKLRLVAEHAAHFTEHPDLMLAVAFDDDLHDHLRAVRRLAGRGVRRIRTQHRCTRSACDGQLVSTLGEDSDAALACDTCDNRVPYVVWSAWPKQRLAYITPAHAAKIVGCTVQAVYQRARYGKWKRVGTGRDVQYAVEDVRKSAGVTA